MIPKNRLSKKEHKKLIFPGCPLGGIISCEPVKKKKAEKKNNNEKKEKLES